METVPAALRTTALAALDAEIRQKPTADGRCQRAALIDLLGRTQEALECYLSILRDHPDHAGTLNALGALLHRTAYRSAARTVFARAVACHPEDLYSRVNLANVLREFGDLDSAESHLEAALRVAPDFAQAHQALGDVFGERGDTAKAECHWHRGYTNHALNAWPFRGQAQPLRILMLISVANGNLAARPFLDDQVFAVTTLAMEFYIPDLALPPHDLVLNAIGDADLCHAALASAQDIVARSNAPIINHPLRIVRTGRAENEDTLRSVAGVVTPRTAMVSRTALAAADGPAALAALGLGFPVLLRAPGFHTGRHFLRADNASHLAPCAASLPGEQVLAIEYLDACGADGKARKGRVMTIDGRLYPLHWAVSSHWKVHYFTAEMAEHPCHRAEEALFLADIASFLGAPAIVALRNVAEQLNLDYGGIDFALMPDGRIVVFEANATMAIVPPPPGDDWDYRRPAADLALLATRNMLVTRSERTGFLS